ncbi:hypothetical protein GCM10022219_06820 [Microbacterium oryzae]|uniref:Uncharacterized protein n=1 Tax=Microbacterium oryzae TaxID=743009 RepID=A0A6I6E2S4_9MICO|nr:hypothetical protein [Microbacterium oryzae]QGU26780.1 hypothetical protein D7D94_03190 [Microbacterium oryzae]
MVSDADTEPPVLLFLRAMERAAKRWPPLRIEALAHVDGRYAIVIYRERPAFTLSGHIFDMRWLHEAFEPNSPDDLASAMIVEIGEPSGMGQERFSPWLRELVPTGERVGWFGDALPPDSVPAQIALKESSR